MSFYDDASWLLIPSGIKEDVVFAQKPTSGLGDLTFTRASDATYTDSTGVVRRSPYNLLQQSEDFSNAAWSKSASSISSNVTTAPNGTLTADKLIEDTANTSHTIFQTISISASTNYNYSVYLKAAERFRFRIRFTGFSGAQDATVNLNTQTTSLGTLTSVGNGWFRFAWSVNSGAGGSSTLVAITLQDDSGNSTYLGNGTSGAFIWGAQLVEGTSALDYFPTTDRQNVPRIDFRNADGTLSSCGRLLLEPQRTNSIRNSSMVGAVAGSPGTLPTNWNTSTAAGLTQTVVATGIENGLPYVDLRFNGTASATSLRFTTETSSGTAALPSQAWTNSAYFKLTAGTLSQITLRNVYRNSGGGAITTPQQQFDLTSILTRRVFTDAAAPALTAFIQQEVLATLVIGTTYDFTIRIAAPQMELGAYATTWVPTTTAAVTRLVDNGQLSNVYTNGLISAAGGTWFIDLANNTAVTRDSASGGFYINTGAVSTSGDGITLRSIGSPSRLQIAKVVANSSTTIYTTTGDSEKIAIKWNGATADVFSNGVKVVTATSFTTTTMQNLVANAANRFLNISQSALFQTPLTDAQCIQLTT
jgi:hypothetical protein